MRQRNVPRSNQLWESIAIATIATLAIASGFAARPASAAELRSGQHLVVRASETIQDDLYAACQSVQILGTVEGDLVVVADQVSVTGSVSGDVIVFGGTVTLSGPVYGVVRAFGGRVNLDSAVEFDAILGGKDVAVGPGAHVGRDLLVLFGNTEVGGKVERDVRTWTETLTIAGTAVIGGDVTYSGGERLKRDPQATVRGSTRQIATSEIRRAPAAIWLDAASARMRLFIGFAILGLLFAALFPTSAREAALQVSRTPWSSLGLGMTLLVLVPLITIPLTIVGWFTGGWWLGLTALAVWLIALPVAYLTTCLRIGMWMTMRFPSRWSGAITSMLAGLVALELVACVPQAGWGVRIAALLFGVGALGLSCARGVQRNRASSKIVTVAVAPTRPARARAFTPATTERQESAAS